MVAQKSGTDAHGPVERVPGAREAVQTHEDWGKRARNVLLAVGVLEVFGLLLATRGAGKVIRGASALVGLGAAVCIYEAGEHGGDLVYNYAGGVGLRSGSPEDVKRLLVAGLYHQARLARDSGRAEEAARLTDELLRMQPDDPAVRFLAVESRLRDRHDPQGRSATWRRCRSPRRSPAGDPVRHSDGAGARGGRTDRQRPGGSDRAGPAVSREPGGQGRAGEAQIAQARRWSARQAFTAALMSLRELISPARMRAIRPGASASEANRSATR